MSALAWLAIGLALLLMGSWLLTRHIHRWSAWSDPVSEPRGSVQIRRCKDSACNKHQRRDVGL